MKKIYLGAVFSFFSAILYVQVSIKAQRTIRGNSVDNLMDMKPTVDGGYIFVGASYSEISSEKTEANRGKADYWIVKLSKAGAIEWQKTLGGSGEDEPHSIIQARDGGYLVGGTSYSGISGDKTTPNFDSGGYTGDYWVVKLSPQGIMEWQKSYGGSYLDWLFSLNQTKDGGFILSGSSMSRPSGNKTARNVGGTFYADC